MKKKIPRELTVVSVAHTNIPPKEPVVYSKQTQTAQAAQTSHDGKSFKIYNKLFIEQTKLFIKLILYFKFFSMKNLYLINNSPPDNIKIIFK